MVYYDLVLPDGNMLKIEYRGRTDWDRMADRAQTVVGPSFDHVGYQGGHHGQYDGAVIERTDYWYQKESLCTERHDCDEVLYTNPAYDVLVAFAQGSLSSMDNDSDCRGTGLEN